MKPARSTRAVLWALFASLVLTVFSCLAFPLIPLQSDSLDYWNFSLYLQNLVPSVSLFLPPGYPLLLAVAGKLAGPLAGPALLVIQHVLRLAPFALFFYMSRLWPGSLVPAVGAWLWTLFPESYLFSHYLMSESLATALVAGVACSIIWMNGRPGPGRAVLVGMSSGFLAMTRPAGGILLLVALIPVASIRAGKRTATILALALSFVLVLLPWGLHNRAKAGTWMPVNSMGRHLFNRAVAEDGLVAPGDSGMARLNRLIGFSPGAKPTYWWNYVSRLKGEGMTESEADRVFLGVALRAVLAHPVEYIRRTLKGMEEIVFWTNLPPPGASVYRRLENGLCVPANAGEVRAWMAFRMPDLNSAVLLLAYAGGEWESGRLVPLFGCWTRVMVFSANRFRIFAVLLVLGLALFLFRRRKGDNRGAGSGPDATGDILVLAFLLSLFAHSAFEMPVPRYGLPFLQLVTFVWCLVPRMGRLVLAWWGSR